MEFNNSSAETLLFGAFTIAALHALIPSHWLAFALVGRAQRWPLRRTLRVTALAGTGHVLMTISLGLVLAGAGKLLWVQKIPPVLEHAVTSGLLILLGLYFVSARLRGHNECDHDHHKLEAEAETLNPAQPLNTKHRLNSVTTLGGALMLGMTLSPCLDLLSVYVAASRFSWMFLLGISLIMAVTTLTLMLWLVWMTLRGLERWNLRWLEKNEGFVVGGLLISLGILLFFMQ